MSAEKCFSLAIVAYDDSKASYHKWKKRREETIPKIREIVEEIQKLETLLRRGNVVLSSGGIVSGALTIVGILGAPFTLGGSLSLTAVGAATGIGIGVASIGHNWLNSSNMKTKCEEASKLLNECQKLDEELFAKLEQLHDLQTHLCTALGVAQISARSLASIATIGGEALALLLARNIPNMARSSKALSFMFGFGRFNFGVHFSAQSVGKGIGMTVGKQAASSVARNSLRLVGSVVVGAVIVVDVMSLVSNKKALDTNKLCEQASKLKDVADKMEKEMVDIDEVFNECSVLCEFDKSHGHSDMFEVPPDLIKFDEAYEIPIQKKSDKAYF